MKTLAIILVPLLCAAADRPNAIETLAGQAHAAPGEFAADVLIRIAALDNVDQGGRIQFLEQAFRRASEAQQPYKRHATSPGLGGAGRSADRAYAQDLDGMSLRLRVVEAMLPLDGRKARELFLQVPPPNLPRLTCDDFLVYDVSRFYEVLGSIAARAFDAKEIRAGDPYRLLARHAAAITSPVEVGPMARVLAAASVNDAEFQALVTAFAGALGTISGDDRSFSASRQAGNDILALVNACKHRQASPLPLLEAYRLYLVNHLSAKRCADGALMQGAGQSFGLADPRSRGLAGGDEVSFFNESLAMPPIQPIQPGEAAPSEVAGVARGLRACEDAECRGIAGQYRRLIFEESGSVYPNSYRTTAEWQSKLREFLSAMAAWQQSTGASAAEFFREKSGLYREAFNLAQETPARELVARALLDFLARNRFQDESRIEWFLPLNALIGRLTLDPLGSGRLGEDLRATNDPVIALYTGLERLAPRPPSGIMALF